MRILITGGAGFLGAALANTLVERHEVLSLDDLTAGDPERLDARVLFHRGDVRDRPKLWTLLHGVDCVYHLAARVLVAESLLYPREYNEINVGGTVTLLEACRDVGVRRVVLASSGAVYGAPARLPIPEITPPQPQSPYAVSKLAAEHYLHAIGALWGLDTVALRIFNAYGPGQMLPPSHAPVVPRFLRQALGGGSLVIFGSGEQTRDFVYVDDVVQALAAACNAPDVNRQTINVGSGVETSIMELARLTLRITGGQGNILQSSADTGGAARLQADIALAHDLLGYVPQIALEEGLQRTLRLDARFTQRVR